MSSKLRDYQRPPMPWPEDHPKVTDWERWAEYVTLQASRILSNARGESWNFASMEYEDLITAVLDAQSEINRKLGE